MKGKFKNPGKEKFLADIPLASLDSPSDDLALRCKFNFSFYDVPKGKTGFEAWGQSQLHQLIIKLKDFGRKSLADWKITNIGSASGRVLSIYGAFPNPSNYPIPKNVPHQAEWGRFRLDTKTRLCGFVVPASHHDQLHKSGARFDSNTFYVVFIDDSHDFYISPKRR